MRICSKCIHDKSCSMPRSMEGRVIAGCSEYCDSHAAFARHEIKRLKKEISRHKATLREEGERMRKAREIAEGVVKPCMFKDAEWMMAYRDGGYVRLWAVPCQGMSIDAIAREIAKHLPRGEG